MRCLCCNVILSDKEATRRYAASGEFVDTCDRCLDTIPDFPETVVRPDLDEDSTSLQEDTIF